MALSNSQYDHLMRTYEQKQLDNEFQLRKRYEKAYALIPELEEVDHSISSLSVKKARLLPANYLELHYQCPDCKDTGYIGTHKCHCFKKAIVDYLYTQSNLKDILDKENFSTCSLSYYSRNHIDPLTGRSSLESMETALNTTVWRYRCRKDFSFSLHRKRINGFRLFRYLLYSSRTF